MDLPEQKGSSPEPNKLVSVAKKQSKKRKWKKPKDMPKRPLSAYNLFFAHARQEILKTETLLTASSDSDLAGAPKRKMGFAGLARTVATKWKALDPSIRSPYETQAKKEQERYKRELKEWKENQEKQKIRDQLLQAQLVGAAMVQGPTIANFQARSLNEPNMGLQNNKSLNDAPGNQIFQKNSSIASMSQLPNEQPLQMWPAMPQTIASLGKLYDEERSRPTEAPSASSGIVPTQPKGNLDPSLISPHYPRSRLTNTVFPPLSGHLDPTIREGMVSLSNLRNDIKSETRPIPRRFNSLASRLASPQRINNLVLQLDDESFDFLRSLKNSNEEK